MKLVRSLTLLVCFGVLAFTSAAKADEWNKLTKITFSGPVQINKTVLPAGTYIFKLMDSESDRHIVQIFNADQSHIIATILAIPDYRLTPTSHTVVKFSETNDQGQDVNGTVAEAGVPIKEWFYPGDNFGQEFKVKPVQVQTEQSTATVTETAAPAPEPQPEVAEAAPAPAPVPETPTTEDQTPQTDTTPAPAPAPDQTSSDTTTLPQTASDAPFIAMMGVLCLAAAASMRVLLKISA